MVDDGALRFNALSNFHNSWKALFWRERVLRVDQSRNKLFCEYGYLKSCILLECGKLNELSASSRKRYRNILISVAHLRSTLSIKKCSFL